MGILLELDDDAATLLIEAQDRKIKNLLAKGKKSPVTRQLQSIAMKASWAKKRAKQKAAFYGDLFAPAENVRGNGHLGLEN